MLFIDDYKKIVLSNLDPDIADEIHKISDYFRVYHDNGTWWFPPLGAKTGQHSSLEIPIHDGIKGDLFFLGTHSDTMQNSSNITSKLSISDFQSQYQTYHIEPRISL